jgi:hypothetical protein
MPDSDQPQRPDESSSQDRPNEAMFPRQRHVAWFRHADRETQNLVLRVIGCALVLIAGQLVLITMGVGLKLQYSFELFSIGIVCFIETLWRRDLPIEPPPQPVTAGMAIPQSPRSEWEEKLRRTRRREQKNFIRAVTEFILLVATAVASAFLSHALTVSPPTFQVAPLSELQACQKDLAGANDALNRCQAKNADQGKAPLGAAEGVSNGGGTTIASLFSPFTLLLLAIVALVIFGLIAKKHKEAVPLAGAAVLAEEAFRHAHELSKVNESMYRLILHGFLVCAAMLLLLFLVTAILDIRKLNGRNPGPAPGIPRAAPSTPSSRFEKLRALFAEESESKSDIKENYLSSLGFSVLVLLWAAVMVLYQTTPEKRCSETNTPNAQETIAVKRLDSLSNFGRGNAEIGDKPSREQWVTEISSQDFRPGDMLFLLGSTDCEAYRLGNTKLAQLRAEQVKGWLKDLETRGINVLPATTDQQIKCASSREVRAVFPFWIQMQKK